MSGIVSPPGPPTEWINWGGGPAAALGAMPSFMHEDGKLAVCDLLVGQVTGDGEFRLYSTWYGIACVLAPGGTVPLHHDPQAWWKWRPLVYRLRASLDGDTHFEAQGSQREVEIRRGLSDLMAHIHTGAPWTFEESYERARAALLEHLTPQQRIEYRAKRTFRLRGAGTGGLYRIRCGNGFECISPWTGKTWISFCLHPEEWMPDEDVALATKLLLEDADLEEQVVGNATATFLSIGRGSTSGQNWARVLEKKLIPRRGQKVKLVLDRNPICANGWKAKDRSCSYTGGHFCARKPRHGGRCRCVCGATTRRTP